MCRGRWLMGLVLAVLAAGSLALGHVRDRLHTARAALQEGQEFLHQRQYEQARTALKHGLSLAEDLLEGASRDCLILFLQR